MFKKGTVLLFVLFALCCLSANAQQLNYQAIARNANGVALTFRDVGIRLSIRDGSPTGSIVYSETRNIRTNQFGLFTVVIGSPGASSVLGSMASINWISGNKYLQVEIDPEGGTTYFQAGTSQLQAVPYALFANAAYPVGPAGGDLVGSTYPNPIIAPLAVTTGKIANQAVTTAKIADLNVTTAKLEDQAVTNPKIQDNTIANIKLVNPRVTLNGLILNLGDAQNFAIGSTGLDVNIVSAGNTHTFNFPDASIANRGLITPNAQTIGGNKTFNNNITAASIIRAGGLASQFLKADGSVDNNIYLTENQPIIVTATGDATGVSTSSRTAPVLPLTLATVNSTVGTYGTNIVIPSITVNNKGLVTNVIANPIPTATSITSGLLTVGDWNIFNNKQNAIPLGSAAQYFRGDLSLSNFQTDVRNQLSAGTNITYVNGNIGLTNNSVTLNSLPLTLGGAQTFATGTAGVDFNINSVGSVHTFNIPTASVFARGLLSSTDYTNFNTAYANRITSLTTTGSSGAATLSGNVLNIPNYTIAGLGGEASITPGTTLQYWRGDKTWQTLNSSVVPEGSNLYYTDTRSRNALSITTTGNNGTASYNNATGIMNIPAYTINGLGGVPTSRLINGLDLSADRNLTTTEIAEGTRLYFTNARSRTAIGITTTGSNGVSTYDNSTGILNIPNYTIAGLGGESSIAPGTTLQYWRGDKTWQTLNSTIVPEGSNLYFTDTRSRNAFSLTTTGNNGVSTYNNATGAFNIPAYTLNGLGGVPTSRLINGLDLSADRNFSTTDIPEGINQYYTNAKSRTAISLTTVGNNGASTYDNTSGTFNIPNYTLTGLGGEPSILGGTTLQYWRGDKTWQTLNTTIVPEGTNEYFTQAKSRGSISLTTTGTSGAAVYSAATGILNIPNYTAGGIGAEATIVPGTINQYWRGDKTWQTLNSDAATEGVANLYFTNARARTSVSLTTLGINGASTYDNTTGILNVPTYTLAGLGGVPTSRLINGVDLTTDRTFTTTNISEGVNQYFTDARARTSVSLTTLGTNGASTYNNTTGVLNVPTYTLAGLGGEASITAGTNTQYWRGDKTWQTLNSDAATEGVANLYFTNARARTSVSLTTVGTNGLSSYDNTTGIFNVPAYTLAGLGGEASITAGTNTQYWRGDKTWQTLNSDAATEGVANLYFTNARARTSVSLTTVGTNGASTYNNTTGVLNVPNYTLAGLGGEASITAGTNTQYWRGDKTWQTLNSDAATEGVANLYFTNARARTSVSLTTVGTNGLSSYDNTTGILNVPAYTLAGLGGVPTSRLINGVDLTADRTFTTTNISEGVNQYFTDARARSAISLTTTGNNGASTYSAATGVLNVPEYTLNGLGGVPTARTLNGVSLAADQTFSVGTSGTTFNITNAGTVHSFNIPNAATALVTGGLLSNTDWTTFNNKQAALSGTGYSKWNTTTVTYVPTIPIADGGTGATTKTAAFDALSPMNADGDLIYGSGVTGSGTRLGIGSPGQILTVVGTTPTWAANTQWSITGNAGLTAGTHFLGTTDNIPLRFRVNNTWAGEVNPASINTSFGLGAGQAITAALAGNTAFGAAALLSNTTSVDHTAVGQNALQNTNGGSNNTAVGKNALQNNVSGFSNTAVGHAALLSSLNNNNSALGKSALTANTDGTNNTGVGHFALVANTTGNANTAVGQNSLSANTTTHNNTAVGFEALRDVTSDGNVGVGYQANVSAGVSSAVTIGIGSSVTANNAIAIGSSASATAANAVAIGNGATNAVTNTIRLGGAANLAVVTSGSMNAGKFVGNNSGTSLTHVSGIINNATAPTLSGNDVAGFITFTTGPVPAGTGDFITVNFGSAYAGGNPVVIIHPVRNNGTPEIAISIHCLPSTTTTGSFIIATGTALIANTQYQIAYHVIGRQ